MSSSAKKSESLFDRLFSNAEEALKNIKRPLFRNQLKRKFETCRDNAVNDFLSAKAKNAELLESVANIEPAELVKNRLTMESALRVIKATEEEYTAMFDENLQSLDIDFTV